MLAPFAKAMFIGLLILQGRPLLAESLEPAQQVDLKTSIAAARELWQVPVLAVAVIHRGETIFEGGFGTLKRGSDTPVDEHTLFAIASNTKAFTTALLAMLVEEGKIDWDDRVREYLPYFELADPRASAEMTIRDLVCHRSGLGTFSGDLLWFGTPYNAADILKRARHLRPTGMFRADYGYSNLMFLAAGEVLSVASGKTWDQLVKEKVFDPLGMNRTVTSVRALSQLAKVATPHKSLGDDAKPIDWYNWDNMLAAGGIISSVHDMSLWLKVQLKRGAIDESKRIFSEDSAEEMWNSQTLVPISADARKKRPEVHFRSYGLGWVLNDYYGRKIVSHGGGYDGMFSKVIMVPEEQFAVVVLTNSMTDASNAIALQTVDDVLRIESGHTWHPELREAYMKSFREHQDQVAQVIRPAEGLPTNVALDPYSGTFRCSMYGDAIVMREANNLTLALTPNPDLVADLHPIRPHAFAIRWRKEFAWFEEGCAQFVTDPKGNVERLELFVPNQDLWFDELKLVKVSAN